jgi:hypothetical protein
MSRSLARRVRLWLLPMLVLGVLLRPVLIFACDLHAATHGHADAPHAHVAGELDANATGDAHGEHDTQQAAKSGEIPAHLSLYVLADAPAPRLSPRARRSSPPPEPGRGTPFRPPIV